MSENNLFQHFDRVTSEDWKEKIIQDLKGKDYHNTLVWNTRENLKVQPFYTPSNIANNHLSRKSSQWQIIAPIHISDTANQEALQNLMGGATGIHFIGSGQNFSIEQLIQEIETSFAPISFQNVKWDQQHKAFWKQSASAKAHLGIDPLHDLHLGQSSTYDLEHISSWLNFKKECNASWGVLAIDGSIYKNSGGHFIDEIAFIISALNENLHQLQQAGYTTSDLGIIQIRTAIGPNFFFEIAKIKAIRTLSEIVAQQYGGAEIEILSESANIYHSQLDTPTNILRLTTEAMSAVLGGSDAVMLHPFDWNEDKEFTHRISRNIQHLLIEESYLSHYFDPTKGTYYIENLIKDLKTPAWNVFLSIEKHQGYIHSFVGKSIPEFFIFRHQLSLKKEVSKRTTVLLGVNQFPNIKENISLNMDEIEKTLKTTILNQFRLSEPFERLRWRMIQHHQKVGKTPSAYLLEYGQIGMRKARASFAFNFLGNAGITSIESTQPGQWDQNIEEIKTLQPEIVVLCSDNESWETIIPQTIAALPQETIFILAGKSDAYPVDFIIYDGQDILETLENILAKLSVA